MNEEKLLLRSRMKAVRAEAFTKEEKAAADDRIAAAFASRFPVSGWLFAYDSFGSEAGTEAIIFRWLEGGGKVALPRMEGPSRMFFYPWNGREPLKRHSFGMREPEGAERVFPEKGSVMLVPALAFDPEGNRLGYGGGFYDAYLRLYGHETVKTGIAYEKQVLRHIPTDERDMSVDMIITDERILEITS